MNAPAPDTQERLQRHLRYLDQDPANLSLLADAADLCLELEQLDQARELIQRGLSASGDAPQFRYRLSCLARAERDWDQAIAISQALLAQGEDSAAIHYNLGVSLMLRGRHQEAKEQLLPLAAQLDSFPNLPHVLVRTLHHLGELDTAAGMAEAQMAAHPDDATMAGMLSTLCVDREDFDGARKWSQLALQSSPDDVDALLSSGVLALSDENQDKAETAFKRAIALQPANGRAWIGQGMAHMQKLDVTTARADFEQALKLAPTHIGSWHALAWCQIIENDLAGAQATFGKALELNRNFGESHGGLATVAALQGQWDEAKKLTATALKLDPQSFSGRFAQSLLLQQRGKGALAQESLRTLLTRHVVPGGGTLMEALGRAARRNRPPG